MVENTQNNVTCTDIGGTDWIVSWDRELLQFGTCDAVNTCDSRNTAIAVLSRSVYSNTTMTIKKATRQAFGNRVVRCSTQRPASPTVVLSEDSCTVDVVVPAVLSAGSVEVVMTSPSWTLRANTTITTVFSSQGRYSCVWYKESQSGASVGSDTSPALSPDASDTSDLSNRTGWCSSSWTMPLTSGTYSYVVVASPGTTTQSAGSVSIARPASPSLGSECPSDYVPELSAVTCTCNTSSLGSPPGVIGWSHDTSSPVLTLPNVTRSDHNKNFTCNVKWSSLTQNTSMELKIAYGPDPGDTTISSADVTNGVFDTGGSRDLHLTCSTPDGAVNPAPSYSWDQPAGCKGQGQGSCTFRPLPPQNVTVTCRVTNQKNSGRVQTVDRTMILNYPPIQAPGITGYSTGHVLYMNDPLSLTCDVTGGNPEVSHVTLKCDNHPLNVTTGQQGRLNIASLTASDHQATCTCSATWKVTSLYNGTGSVSLNVHSPPSVPSISQVSPAQFPYMEGDKPILTCNSSNPGFPPANYTWSGHRSQDNVVTSPDASGLRMAPLTRHDNHRIIVCNASNDYTQHRGDVTPTDHKITVYYKPILNLASSADNNCTFRRDLHPSQLSCIVPEGKPIRFDCSANSNPTVASITWTSPSAFTNGQGGNGQLVIPSADRHAHNTEFNCTATTRNNPPDPRLPLTNSTSLRVYVAYSSSLKALELNNMTTNLTVNESDVTAVSLTCRSDGRPTPRMQLVRKHDRSVLKTVIGGSYTHVDDDTVVDHVISPARCEDTGTYMCVSDNQLGPEERQALSLFVNCKPRSHSTSSTEPLEVNYVDKPVLVVFRLVAFPVPHMNSFKLRVNNSDTNTPDNIKLNVTCGTTNTDYDVNCGVLVSDAKDKGAEGLYLLRAANAFGQDDFLFKVTVNGTMDSAKVTTPEINIAAVVGGICAALVVIAVVVVALFIVRRRNREAKTSQSNLTGSQCVQQREEPEMTVNELYGASPGRSTKDAEDEEMIDNIAYVSSADFENHASRVQGNAYEDVELNSSTNASGGFVSVPGSSRAQASASALKYQTTVNTPNSDDGSNVYATVNKGTKPSLGGKDRPGPAGGEKQRPDVKPKPAQKSKPVKPMKKNTGKKMAKEDDKQLLQAGEYGNVGMASLTMSPHSQEGSVYENYAFQKEEGRKEMPGDEVSSQSVNEDGLVYTTVAFSDKQLKKAAEPPPEREQTEYAGIDFTRKAPPIKENK
ncbi:uncharacterized protein [Littorina saxatilis]|uniref:uncharacterized protein n=1 Tax=Littorina saxatilis TaxID=31220 RepID=UPI0038B4A14C